MEARGVGKKVERVETELLIADTQKLKQKGNNIFILEVTKRNTSKEKKKRNKGYPYKKLKRRYFKMADEETETEEKEEKKEED